MTNTTAAQVIARSSAPVTTRTGGYVPSGHFSALVNLDGIEFEYLFRSDTGEVTPDALALGRIRHTPRPHDEYEHKATAPDGTVVAVVPFASDALACLVRYARSVA